MFCNTLLASALAVLAVGDSTCDFPRVSARLTDVGAEVILADDPLYGAARLQYAAAMVFDNQNWLQPDMIVYAEDEDQVKAVVTEAYTCNIGIAIRSGGHHFFGGSSCYDDGRPCIQLDVSRYDFLEVTGNNMTDDVVVSAGPGVTLAQLYDVMVEHEIFFPAGVCPSVHLGGHSQTGGYGNTIRSQGALVDFIKEYTVVLGNGETVVANADEHTSLFHALKGGSPGAFGVVTNVKINTWRDADYSESRAFRVIYPSIQALGSLGMKKLLRRWNNMFVDANMSAKYEAATEIQFNVIFVPGWVISGSEAVGGIGFEGTYISDQPFAGSVAEELFNYLNKSYLEDLGMNASATPSSVVDFHLDGPPSEVLSALTLSEPDPDSETMFRYSRSFTVDVPYTVEGMDLLAERVYELDLIDGFEVAAVFEVFTGAMMTNDPNSESSAIMHRGNVYTMILGVVTMNLETAVKTFDQVVDVFEAILTDDHFDTARFRMPLHHMSHADLTEEAVWSLYYDADQYAAMVAVKAAYDPEWVFNNTCGVPVTFDDEASKAGGHSPVLFAVMLFSFVL
jgi:FAD/FMN-containing dehydrogenase